MTGMLLWWKKRNKNEKSISSDESNEMELDGQYQNTSSLDFSKPRTRKGEEQLMDGQYQNTGSLDFEDASNNYQNLPGRSTATTASDDNYQNLPPKEEEQMRSSGEEEEESNETSSQ